MTVLIVLIAVFLAYNANTGLPFVPTRELKVDIANGSNLVVGNEVRAGGFRIGVISDMKPVALSNGQTGAQLTLNLDQAHGKVPVDSTATIQPRVGARHRSTWTCTRARRQVISDGGLLPLGADAACRCSSTTCSRRLIPRPAARCRTAWRVPVMR